jgi:tungstate transport system substrate-binding protein
MVPGFFAAIHTAVAADNEVVALTTTTTQDSGILRHITEAFERKTGTKVKTIVAGSGDILRQGARGEGDVLLTHSPAAEKEWMAQGHGLSRSLVMYNDFVIIGPAEGPAGVKGLRAAEALRRIADKKVVFVSRGDQSGTNVSELAMWRQAGINPKGEPWYLETGQGQGLTMEVAATRQGYAYTDRGTYLVRNGCAFRSSSRMIHRCSISTTSCQSILRSFRRSMLRLRKHLPITFFHQKGSG